MGCICTETSAPFKFGTRLDLKAAEESLGKNKSQSWKQPKCTLGVEWINKLGQVNKGISAENK
jgi:uncharacterized protein (DUF4213/DUF364 family)